ncbi:hypothetical protein CASFOL_027275 [Castilleja foliolosa]|uniref:Myb/SANT-like domain-containing protein n=1 Tax=Castilleja foliolosa TaxID=1961234 RepID=A0ABD3CFB1_9LAMI
MDNVLPPNRGDGETHFLKLMAEEMENGGYTPGTTFKHESMLYVFRKFRRVYGPIFSDRFLKTKFKKLKTRYQEFSVLMSHDDIYWNKQSNVISGDENLLREKYRVKNDCFYWLQCPTYLLIDLNKQSDLAPLQARYRHGVYLGECNYDLMRQIFEVGVSFE